MDAVSYWYTLHTKRLQRLCCKNEPTYIVSCSYKSQHIRDLKLISASKEHQCHYSTAQSTARNLFSLTQALMS